MITTRQVRTDLGWTRARHLSNYVLFRFPDPNLLLYLCMDDCTQQVWKVR